MSIVSYSRDGAVARLTISRPERRNALNHTALDELHATARELECEMWLAGVSHRESKLDARGIPESVARFDDKVAVVVALGFLLYASRAAPASGLSRLRRR